MDRVVPLHDPANYAAVIARIRKIYESGTVVAQFMSCAVEVKGNLLIVTVF